MPDPETAQAALFAWLGEGAKRIDTQGAVVFLKGDEAYKIRRAIRLPFLDYSTLEKRRSTTEQEIALNQESAPEIYLGAVPITREGSGFALGGAGEIVEWATHMRRFDEDSGLDRLAERGELDPALIRELAKAIHAAHARAPRRAGEPWLRAIGAWLDQNRDAFAAWPDLFPPEHARALDASAQAALAAITPLLRARGEAGYVRRCHGDLHLRNIVVIEGKPTPFDAIEFDETIATGDILYDLAFTVMDLWERDLRAQANKLLNDYLALGDEDNLAGLVAFPFFLSLRAAIRAKVEAANLNHVEGAARERTAAAARRYFEFAQRFLEPRPPCLIGAGGLSGTGKSVLARAIAPELGRAPGAILLRSDVERKHRFGLDETESLPAGAYDGKINREIYATLARKARAALAAGSAVIVDAVHSHRVERAGLARLAADAGVRFTGFWLEAPLQVRLARVGARQGDASDADAGIARGQSAEPLGEPGWHALDASGDLAATLNRTRAALGLGPSIPWPAAPPLL